MSYFSTWLRGIKGRLLFAACLPVVGFLIVFSVANNGTGALGKVIDSSHKELIPNILALGEMRQSRNKFGFEVWNTINEEAPEQKAKSLEAAKNSIKEFEESYKAYTNAPSMPEEAALDKEIKPIVLEFIKTMSTVADLVAIGTPEKNAEAKQLLLTTFRLEGQKIRAFNGKVLDLYRERVKNESSHAEQTKSFVFNMLIMISLLATFLTFGVIIWISSRLSTSVAKIANNLSSSSTQVTTSVEQLNEAGNSLSQSSTEAAASLEETVAALEEMSSMVQMNSDNAKQAAALSTSSRDSAEAGEKEIKNLILSMSEISKSSKRIEEIISVIDDIAFQTNLLALNAAVEAARAGEQGKGFAVVAEAVRALAQRSASSAKDISSLIKESVDQISNGSQIADKSGTVLSNIVTSIKKVSDLNHEIAAASSEQTTGIQQISKAMNQLDQSSQSNAASAEEIAATSGEISNLALGTQNLTAELNALVLGTNFSPKDGQSSDSDLTDAHRPQSKKSSTAKSKSVKFNKSSDAVPTKEATVHTLQPKKTVSKSSASEMIPFDEDETRSKVGTTDGF